jgi:hypothetical protein
VDLHTATPYWAAARRQRMECVEETLRRIPALGVKLPSVLASLDPLLASLERVACCMDGCPGPDKPHALQRLVGRGVSSTLAAMELCLQGHYDEALMLARGIGEAANLGWLFAHVQGTYNEWLRLDGRKRWEQFRPKSVRQRLAAAGKPIPIDESRYSILSGETAHPTPETQPQRFNAEVPTLGGYYQEGGVFIAFNEVAAAIAILGPSVVPLIPEASASTREEVKQRAVDVLRNVGGVTSTELSSVRRSSRPGKER